MSSKGTGTEVLASTTFPSTHGWLSLRGEEKENKFVSKEPGTKIWK